jgi:hypothetical protein
LRTAPINSITFAGGTGAATIGKVPDSSHTLPTSSSTCSGFPAFSSTSELAEKVEMEIRGAQARLQGPKDGLKLLVSKPPANPGETTDSYSLPTRLRSWPFPPSGCMRDFATLQVMLDHEDKFFASDQDRKISWTEPDTRPKMLEPALPPVPLRRTPPATRSLPRRPATSPPAATRQSEARSASPPARTSQVSSSDRCRRRGGCHRCR